MAKNHSTRPHSLAESSFFKIGKLSGKLRRNSWPFLVEWLCRAVRKAESFNSRCFQEPCRRGFDVKVKGNFPIFVTCVISAQSQDRDHTIRYDSLVSMPSPKLVPHSSYLIEPKPSSRSTSNLFLLWLEYVWSYIGADDRL